MSNIDTDLARRINIIRARATDAGDMATVDACIQALRGDIHELFGLTALLAEVE